MSVSTVLERLVRLQGAFGDLLSEYQRDSSLGDFSRQEVTLTPADLNHALTLFETGKMSDTQIKEWAEVLELDDNVMYAEDSEALADAVFQLSSPEINGPLDSDMVSAIRARIGDRE